MRLTFLGTSAANAFPEPFCRCENCLAARQEGGKSLRKRSAALVNDDLLIDLGPDIMTAAHQHAIDFTRVHYCLQTHPHADHLDLSHLLSRSPGFGVVSAPRLHFYASKETLDRAAQTFRRDLSSHELCTPEAEAELNFQAIVIAPRQEIQVGEYRVIPFPANHAHGFGALLYAIERDGIRILYATDTASLPEETWNVMHQHQLAFDLVILDHTYGPDEAESDHLNAAGVVRHMRRMREEGLLKSGGQVFATHIAHEGNPPHTLLVKYAEQHGYQVAYDGLILDV